MILLTMLLLAGYARPEMLVEAGWLEAHLRDRDVRVIDVRLRGYSEGHIPGAVPLDIKETRDPKNAPTFLPDQKSFEQRMKRAGVTSKTLVVAYDDRGGIYAARLWWLLNYYGHSRVALLNGGWTKWVKDGKATSKETSDPADGEFRAKPDPSWLATATDVQGAIGKSGTKIVDARTQAEFDGRETAGVKRSGRIPSAVPVYWEDGLDPELKMFKPAAELEKLFENRGIAKSDRIITYCLVGLRASHDTFVLRLLGYRQTRVYLGSWEDWGNREDLPIVTGKPN